MSVETPLKRVLELFHQGRLNVVGLAKLMEAFGARKVVGDPGDVEALAEELGVLVALEHKTSVIPSKESLETSHVPRTQMSRVQPVLSSSSQELPKTMVRNVDPESGMVAAVTSTVDVKTPLSEYCLQSGIVPAPVSPVLSADSPPLDGPGEERYAIGRMLGEGGVGQVFLGVDRDLRRAVAIKTLHVQNRMDSVQLQAFLEEAIITGGLEHPNIVPVYELGWSEERGPYYVMKRLRGRPLSSELKALRRGDEDAERRSPLFRLLSYFVEASQAIAYAHRYGVIHCDLKPANIMIGELGEVLVVDWGLARVLGTRGMGQARAKFWSGTPAYMPPEQATGTLSDLDAQTDVWALGAILYEILTLTVPFPARTSEETLLRLVKESVEPPGKRAPERHVPPALEAICMRALEKDKALRYATLEELLGDLQSYLEGTRERRRRHEVAEHAQQEAAECLLSVRAQEEGVDALQSEGAGGGELGSLRDDLVFAYDDATRALLRGLDASSEHPGLHDLAGRLYWRIFTRLYPGRVPAREEVRDRALALMMSLSTVSMPAIVSAARRMGSSVMPAAGTLPDSVLEDPWLGAVLSFCGHELSFDGDRAPGSMAPLIRRIAFLKGVPIFSALSGSDLLPIADACEELAFDAGHVIFERGDLGDALFVILEGEVEIVRDDVVLNTLSTLDCFGEIAVLDTMTRTASVRCVAAVRCLMLTAPRFRQIVIDNGDIGLSVMRVLTGRLREATEREVSLRSTLDT